MMDKIDVPILDSKNVCNDLINRLQSKVPQSAADFPRYGEATKFNSFMTQEQKIAALEDGLKSLKERLEFTLTPEAEPEKRLDDAEVAKKVSTDLQVIVDDFNNKLVSWHEASGCVVNFGWSYGGGKKRLEILGIDYIVYRKEPPSEKALKDALSKPSEK
jgi:hypothetical protein